MADIKWIKVAVDMFEDSKIDFLRGLPEGDSIIVIWLQLLSIAGKCNADGYLMVTDGIPYSEQMLSNTLRRNPVLMQFALETFIRLKMVNVEDGPFHITKWEKHQSVEQMGKIRSKNAIKQAEWRERQKQKQLLLQESNETVTETVTRYVTNNVTNSYSNHTDIELDKEKDLKDIVDANASTRTHKRFIQPTLEDVTAYCDERQNGVDPEKWYDHYTSNGWKVGKNPMKDWKAAVRTWEKTSMGRGSSNVGKTGQAARMEENIMSEKEWKEQERLRYEAMMKRTAEI